jgi:hypothetical protein
MNLNFTNSTNKYSLVTEVKSITFDESGGIVVKKTDNSSTTETLTLMKSITLDETSGGGEPLPVELQSFTVTRELQNIQLKWKTVAETNNYGFGIERKQVGGLGFGSNGQIINPKTQSSSQQWEKIGFREGNGNSNVPHEYVFNDLVVSAGQYSFRLKQIDRDGKFTYSQSVEVTISSIPTVFSMDQNYPNPFNPTTVISYQLSAVRQTSLIVYDVIGREVAVLVNEVKEAGYYSTQFDGTHLASGIYFARLTSGGKSQMRKLVLMK